MKIVKIIWKILTFWLWPIKVANQLEKDMDILKEKGILVALEKHQEVGFIVVPCVRCNKEIKVVGRRESLYKGSSFPICYKCKAEYQEEVNHEKIS